MSTWELLMPLFPLRRETLMHRGKRWSHIGHTEILTQNLSPVPNIDLYHPSSFQHQWKENCKVFSDSGKYTFTFKMNKFSGTTESYYMKYILSISSRLKALPSKVNAASWRHREGHGWIQYKKAIIKQRKAGAQINPLKIMKRSIVSNESLGYWCKMN